MGGREGGGEGRILKENKKRRMEDRQITCVCVCVCVRTHTHTGYQRKKGAEGDREKKTENCGEREIKIKRRTGTHEERGWVWGWSGHALVGVVSRQEPAEQTTRDKQDEVEDGHTHRGEVLRSLPCLSCSGSNDSNDHVEQQ